LDPDGNLCDPATGDCTGAIPATSSFQISNSAGFDDHWPELAFDLTNEQFLVVYHRNTADIFGQRVSTSSLPVNSGSEITISSAANNQRYPSVAYDSDNSAFFVVWMDDRPAGATENVYGQAIDSSGSLIGTNLQISQVGPIPATQEDYVPTVYYDPQNQNFITFWIGLDGDDDLYYQRVNGSSGLVGNSTSLQIDTSESPKYGSAAYYPVCRNFLVAYYDGAAVPDEIKTLFIGACSAEPVVSSFAPASAAKGDTVTITGSSFTGATVVTFGGVAAASFTVVSDTQITAVLGDGKNGAISVTAANGTGTKTGFICLNPILEFNAEAPKGVSPGTGATGETFYFVVNYTSGNSTAPTTTELLIDLDGDGSFGNSNAVFVPWSGFPRFPGPPAILWLISIGLTLIMLWKIRQHSVPIRLAGVTLLFGLVIGGATACSSSSSSSDDEASVASEQNTMLEVDATDTDYTDGKLYGVRVQFENAGTFAYKFNIADGQNNTIGEATVTQSLTVEAASQ
jgi:hypothetical protein